MDFEKLFDGMELSSDGRKSFYELYARRNEPEFSASVAEAFEVYEKGDVEFGEYIAAFATKQNVPAAVLTLYIYMLMCEKSISFYNEKGIDVNIFYATMRDVTEQCECNLKNDGVYGIPQVIYRRWFRRYIGCEIFRLGRFNFQVSESIYDTEIEGIVVKKGDPCISVHIPGGSGLAEDVCEESYALAREFFKKYFGMETPIFFCYSWLIQPWLAEELSGDSSIVKFQSKYKIIDFVDDPGDMLRWVFPETCENPEDYPEDTSVRRAAKARIIRGDIIGYGSGVRV